MGLNVCPAAIVAAPIETVWELLADPVRIGEWVDAQIERSEPAGSTAAGQVIHLTSKGFGRTWPVTFYVIMVNQERHQLHMQVTLPLGMHLEEHLSCVPIDATSCRVQFG